MYRKVDFKRRKDGVPAQLWIDIDRRDGDGNSRCGKRRDGSVEFHSELFQVAKARVPRHVVSATN